MKDVRRVAASPFRLFFRSLFESGNGYAFPCDSEGRVNLDELDEHARNDYFYARAMVGREVAPPAVEPAEPGRREPASNHPRFPGNALTSFS